MEPAYPCYLGFGVYLIIYLLSSARQHTGPFYVELAYPGNLGFVFCLIINFLFPARRRGFLFYVELASPAIWVLEVIQLSTCILPPVDMPFHTSYVDELNYYLNNF